MKSKKQLKKYIDNYQDDIKFFQDTFLRERLLGARELSDDKLKERMRYLGLRMDGPLYCVLIFAPYLLEKEANDMDAILADIMKSFPKYQTECSLHTFQQMNNP